MNSLVPAGGPSVAPTADRRLDQLPRIAALVLLAAIAFALTSGINGPDTWLHLASGRWMWDHRQLLDHDPFGPGLDFGEGTARSDFVLRQDWLALILFHGVTLLGGLKGLILLRVAVLGPLFALVWRRVRAAGAPAALAAVLVGATAELVIVETSYVAVRPQMFTTLGLVLLLELLDRAFAGRRAAQWALPALFAVWSNLHGGVVLGMGVAAVYALARARSLRQAPRPFAFVGAAILAAGLNPCAFEAIRQALESGAAASPYWRQIIEWQSILDHGRLAMLPLFMPALSALAIAGGVGLVAMVVRREARPEQVAMALLAAVLGVRAIRFLPFFGVVAAETAALGLAPWVARWAEGRVARARRAWTIASAATVLVVAAWFLRVGAGTSALGFEKPYDASLAPAVTFIRDEKLSGVLFNNHDDGGYLLYFLPADVKVFIDAHALSMRAYDLYQRATRAPEEPAPFAAGVPTYKAVLALAGADLVLLPGAYPIVGVVNRLSEVLLRDPEWAVVFADERAILFVRRTGPLADFARARALPAAAGYENMLAIAARAAQQQGAHSMGEWKLTAALALTRTGRGQDAIPLLFEYEQMSPDDPLVSRLNGELVSAGVLRR
jgi:hypothetical protein